MQRRILYLVLVYFLAFIILIYRGFMPREPKRIPVETNTISELAMELKVNYPEVDKVDAEIFNNVLKVEVVYKGVLEDLNSQSILRVVKNSIYEKDIGKLIYGSIAVSISNTSTSYRYTTAAPLNNDRSAITTWMVSKTVIINDKDINSEFVFKE